MATAPPMTIRVAGTQAGIRDALEAFDAFRSRCALGHDAAWPVQVALDEVLANIVGHAYGGRSDGVIDLDFTLTSSTLVVTVCDDGPAVDPLALPEPDTALPLEARQPGGLGIRLVTHLMQQVEYSRRDGRNRLVLIRELAPPSNGPG